MTWAATGPEGLEAALLGDFPLIILDVMLPGQDGFSIARELRGAGVDAFLVGEAFMRADDPGAALRGMFGT